jgi:hypothetical protein
VTVCMVAVSVQLSDGTCFVTVCSGQLVCNCLKALAV